MRPWPSWLGSILLIWDRDVNGGSSPSGRTAKINKMKNAQGKIPYALKVLETTLTREQKNLEYWHAKKLSADPLVVRMADGSLPSCESRVQQLVDAIEELKRDIAP